MELRIVPDHRELGRPSNVRVPPRDLEKMYRATMRLWNLQCLPTMHCPAGKPVLLERKHLRTIRQNYVVSQKADGVRYMLLMHQVDSARIACLWSLTGEAYEITVIAPDQFFEGTVLDGELVWQDSPRRMVYRVFDMVALRGVSYTEHAYADRMRLAARAVLDESTMTENEKENLVVFASGNDADVRFLENPPRLATVPGANSNDLCIEIKPFYPTSRAVELWESSGENVDGLIFTPNLRGVFGRVPINTARNTFKWKPFSSIDVLYDPRVPDAVYGCDDAGDRCALDAERFRADFDNVIFQVLHDRDGTPPCVVECRCEAAESGNHIDLFPMRHRHDKDVPNKMRTILATINTLSCNISVEELIEEGAGREERGGGGGGGEGRKAEQERDEREEQQEEKVVEEEVKVEEEVEKDREPPSKRSKRNY